MFWNNRRVFLTGHTGFKGSWLSLWLQKLNADVIGYSLEPPTNPSLYEVAEVGSRMISIAGDICDSARLRQAISDHTPEIVIHMAAQPIVRDSYADPIGTYKTNALGTATVLDAIRTCKSVRAVVVITTDKCYENREWLWPYREDDQLGGYDPYSSSKACAELIVSSYRNSFFSERQYQQHGVAIASARAGNVIGGGDWAKDRLVPDIMRAFIRSETVRIRYPLAIRPWQHVLEPLRGYLLLAEKLYREGPRYSGPWNFGPRHSDTQTVESLVKRLASNWGPGAAWELDASARPHEAGILKLDWSKASQSLDWEPALNLDRALALTAAWYKQWHRGADIRAVTVDQIEQYEALAKPCHRELAESLA